MRDEETVLRRYGTRRPDETDDVAARRIAGEHFDGMFRSARVTHANGDSLEVEAVVPMLCGRVLQREPGSDAPAQWRPARDTIATARLSSPVDADGAPVEVTR